MTMVKVACRQVNGVTLRLFGRGFDDGTGDGVKPIVPQGAPVTLRGPSARDSGAGATERLDLAPPTTEVDEEFMKAWLKQNELNPLVISGLIYCLTDEQAAPAPEAETRRPL